MLLGSLNVYRQLRTRIATEMFPKIIKGTFIESSFYYILEDTSAAIRGDTQYIWDPRPAPTCSKSHPQIIPKADIFGMRYSIHNLDPREMPEALRCVSSLSKDVGFAIRC